MYDSFRTKVVFGRSDAQQVTGLKATRASDILKELVPEVKKVSIPENCGVDDWQLFGWLSKHNINLKEFLTNKKYVVIQDGDVYCIWKDLIDCGLIDKKVIENMEDQ